MKPRAYASGTTVPVEKTRAEIERLLMKHGATQLGIISDSERGIALVIFTITGRQVRLRVPLPVLGDVEANGRHRAAGDECIRRFEQLTRQRWRALLLFARAKLQLVELGLSTVEREFLAHIALPDGQTVEDVLLPQLEEAYRTGHMPPLLPPGGLR